MGRDISFQHRTGRREGPHRNSVECTDCKLVAGCLCEKINGEDRDVPHVSNSVFGVAAVH